MVRTLGCVCGTGTVREYYYTPKEAEGSAVL